MRSSAQIKLCIAATMYMVGAGSSVADSEQELFVSGFEKLVLGKYSEASDLFSRGLDINSSPMVRFYRGLAEEGAGDILLAWYDFERAYDELPEGAVERTRAKKHADFLGNLLISLRQKIASDSSRSAWSDYVIAQKQLKSNDKVVICLFLVKKRIKFKDMNSMYSLYPLAGADIVLYEDEWKGGRFKRHGYSVGNFKAAFNYGVDQFVRLTFDHYVRQNDEQMVDLEGLIREIRLFPDHIEPKFRYNGIDWAMSGEYAQDGRKAACSQSAAAASQGIPASPGEPY
jgi:hypothetical protein